jgi:hypothetical protein
MSIKSDAIVIRDETTTNANTALRVGTNLVSIADDLISKQSEIDLNTAKVGITTQQATDITTNNSKVGYTESLVSANTDVVANTAKISFDSASSTKLGGIDAGAEVNTINSKTISEPTGSDLVYNVVSLTQSEYDAGSPVATTFYIING